jgi:hypothetical protein
LPASEWLITITGNKPPPSWGQEANNINVVLEAQETVKTGESNTNSQGASRPKQPTGPKNHADYAATSGHAKVWA